MVGAESDGGGQTASSVTLRSSSSHISSDLADPLLALVAQAPRRSSATPSPSPGDVLDGKYRLEQQLGRGGTGIVFQARHLVTDRRVAIKWMRPRDDASSMRQRFVTEARAAGKIQHPNIIDIFDVAHSETTTYLVMELLEGESLRTRLRRGRLSPPEAIRIALAILGGLSAAHRHGVIHRDLKPENVFLCSAPEGTVKVLDFGICRLSDDTNSLSSDLTRIGEFVGTPVYTALERLRDRQPFDHRVDIYSVGVILYESLCGELPFTATNLAELTYQLATERPRPLPASLDHHARSLQSALDRALARSPEDRFPDADSLAHALRSVGAAGFLPSGDGTKGNLAAAPRIAVMAALLCLAGDAQMLVGTRARRPEPDRKSATSPTEASVLNQPQAALTAGPAALEAFTPAPEVPTTQRPPTRLRSRRAVPTAASVPGEVRVIVIPYGQVWIDGASAGFSPVTMKLAPGHHSVTAGRSTPETSAAVDVVTGEAQQLVLKADKDAPTAPPSVDQAETSVQR